MADETQTTPVTDAKQTVTQENKKKLYVYYFSDPEGATRNLRFHPIYSEIPFDKLPWHVHDNAPAEDLKNPVWSTAKDGWVEDIQTGKDEILQAAQDKIEELDKSKATLDETVKTLQAQEQTGTTQTLAMTKAIKQLSDSQANQNKLLSSMQKLMLQIASTQKAPATPVAVPTAPTQPADK